MYQLKNMPSHQAFAQYLVTKSSDLQLVLCIWVTYDIQSRHKKKVTYEDIMNTPSVILFNADIAAGFRENSTIPSPVGLPRSSTTTIALSTSPNIENVCSRISLEIC